MAFAKDGSGNCDMALARLGIRRSAFHIADDKGREKRHVARGGANGWILALWPRAARYLSWLMDTLCELQRSRRWIRKTLFAGIKSVRPRSDSCLIRDVKTQASTL